MDDRDSDRRDVCGGADEPVVRDIEDQVVRANGPTGRQSHELRCHVSCHGRSAEEPHGLFAPLFHEPRLRRWWLLFITMSEGRAFSARFQAASLINCSTEACWAASSVVVSWRPLAVSR